MRGFERFVGEEFEAVSFCVLVGEEQVRVREQRPIAKRAADHDGEPHPKSSKHPTQTPTPPAPGPRIPRAGQGCKRVMIRATAEKA